MKSQRPITLPPNPQMVSRGQILSGGLAVLLRPVSKEGTISMNYLRNHGHVIHPKGNEGGTASTSFMQGGNRAPTLIRATEDGPSIGLMVG